MFYRRAVCLRGSELKDNLKVTSCYLRNIRDVWQALSLFLPQFRKTPLVLNWNYTEHKCEHVYVEKVFSIIIGKSKAQNESEEKGKNGCYMGSFDQKATWA